MEIQDFKDMTPEEVAAAEAEYVAQEARRAKAGKPPGCPTCDLPRMGSAGACMACGELWPDLVEARAEIEQLRAEVAVLGGAWCAENRAAGRDGCGACAWCCQQQRERAERAEAKLARVEKLADDWVTEFDNIQDFILNELYPVLEGE